MRDGLFAHDLAADKKVVWKKTGERSAVAEIDLGKAHPVGIVRIAEDIGQGQRIAKYVLHGAADDDWKELVQGSTIGACKLDRIASAPLRKLRVTVLDAIAPPLPLRIAAYPGEVG